MLELCYAYAYDDPYVAGLTSFLCFAFCFVVMLMLMFTCELGLKEWMTSFQIPVLTVLVNITKLIYHL